jgi:hypothetical protein
MFLKINMCAFYNCKLLEDVIFGHDDHFKVSTDASRFIIIGLKHYKRWIFNEISDLL